MTCLIHSNVSSNTLWGHWGGLPSKCEVWPLLSSLGLTIEHLWNGYGTHGC